MSVKKVLEIQNLNMTYHTVEEETEALNNINLKVYEGEIVVIVGPSGCGKSTLLSLVAGLIEPSSGTIKVNGTEVKECRKDIGYMFQKDHLFEWRNILDNVLLGLQVQGKIDERAKGFAIDLLKSYGLGKFNKHYPRQLSGGMRQRAALIRTLVTKPDFLLLDEPFSALDYQTRLVIADEIGTILKKEGRTALMVTHDIAEAISMADRIIVLSNRPAKIQDIIEIKLTCPDGKRTPMNSRKAPEFGKYFNQIWEELKVYVK